MKPLLTALFTLALLLITSCTQDDSDAADERVVLYCTADSVYAKPIINAFEAQTGITVLFVGDTEATKTTGLATRLLSEHQQSNDNGAATLWQTKHNAKGGVWWSSEPFWTIKLDRQGVFAPYTPPADLTAGVDSWRQGGWLRSDQGTWLGFALRRRVIVYNTNALSTPPDASIRALLDPAHAGRIGIARPQFGTTQGHMAGILHAWGEQGLADYLTDLSANDVRLYDGNMAVVRAVANGEITLGLTDTDDVYAGQRNNWPIASVTLPLVPSQGGAIPNTVALVKGSRGTAAQQLVDFLISAQAERLLAESDSHNLPARPSLCAQLAADPELSPYIDDTDPQPVDLPAIADHLDEAVNICNEHLPE